MEPIVLFINVFCLVSVYFLRKILPIVAEEKKKALREKAGKMEAFVCCKALAIS